MSKNPVSTVLLAELLAIFDHQVELVAKIATSLYFLLIFDNLFATTMDPLVLRDVVEEDED